MSQPLPVPWQASSFINSCTCWEPEWVEASASLTDSPAEPGPSAWGYAYSHNTPFLQAAHHPWGYHCTQYTQHPGMCWLHVAGDMWVVWALEQSSQIIIKDFGTG